MPSFTDEHHAGLRRKYGAKLAPALRISFVNSGLRVRAASAAAPSGRLPSPRHAFGSSLIQKHRVPIQSQSGFPQLPVPTCRTRAADASQRSIGAAPSKRSICFSAPNAHLHSAMLPRPLPLQGHTNRLRISQRASLTAWPGSRLWPDGRACRDRGSRLAAVRGIAV